MKLFHIFDTKANGTYQRFHAINAATAIRTLTDAIARGEINSAFTYDYALYEIGEEDPANDLRFFALEDPKHVIDLHELLGDAQPISKIG